MVFTSVLVEVVSFEPQPLYPHEKNPLHSLDRRLGDPRTRSRRRIERRKILPLPGLELRPLLRPARGQSLYQLRYPVSNWTIDEW
jgi:hypothetical protein